jgi:hypothetical protein
MGRSSDENATCSMSDLDSARSPTSKSVELVCDVFVCLPRPVGAQNRMCQKTNFTSRFNAIWVVQM